MVGTVRIGAIAISPRPGQVRLLDVLPQVGDAEELVVRVVNLAGMEQAVQVRRTQRWGATSWRPALQCARCHGAATVLHLEDERAVCGRCVRLRSVHHRLKNCRAWTEGHMTADAIVRLALRSRHPGPRSRQTQRLAGRLERETFAIAATAIELAGALTSRVDKAFGSARLCPGNLTNESAGARNGTAT
jgi:hypothetical protein